MTTFPKRTVDLEVGDVVCMYGAREEVVAVHRVDYEARYTAVSVRLRDVAAHGSGREHDVSFDNNRVSVELKPGEQLVALTPDELEVIRQLRAVSA